VQIILDNISYC